MTMGNGKEYKVKLRESLADALYSLQSEEKMEWGGGIDFEIVRGKPQVERVLAYFGEKGTIPERIYNKYSDDVEVLFHTHPGQDKVQPSIADIHSFLLAKQNIEFIIAGKEIMILEKRPEAKPVRLEIITESLPRVYNPDKYMPDIIEALHKFGIEETIIPRKSKIVFDLEVVRGITFDIEKDLVDETSPDKYISYVMRLYGFPSRLISALIHIVYIYIKLYDSLCDYFSKKGRIRLDALEEVILNIFNLQDSLIHLYIAVREIAKRPLPPPPERMTVSIRKYIKKEVPLEEIHSSVLKLILDDILYSDNYREKFKLIFPRDLIKFFISLLDNALIIYEYQKQRNKAKEELKTIPVTDKEKREEKEWTLNTCRDDILLYSEFVRDDIDELSKEMSKIINFRKTMEEHLK